MNQTNSTPSQLEELMEFPCQFNLKVMGYNKPELIAEVVAIISQQCSGFNPESDIATKPSAKGNYIAITAMINAESKAQLDIIYQELHNHPLVKMTL